MTANSTFQDLRIWQQAMNLTVEIYRVTGGFPKHETYGLGHRCGARPFRCRAILPKGKDTTLILSSCAFFFMPGGLFWSSRRSF